MSTKKSRIRVWKLKSSSNVWGFFSKQFFSSAISTELKLIAIIWKNMRASLQQYVALENLHMKLIKTRGSTLESYDIP